VLTGLAVSVPHIPNRFVQTYGINTAFTVTA